MAVSGNMSNTNKTNLNMTMLKKALLLASLLVVLSVSAVFAQGQFKYEPQAKLTVDPAIKVGKLKNGLTYYIRQNKLPENKAELRLVVNAGSVLERDDQQGLAHFCEHMAFNGSKDFQKNDLIKVLESMGVRFGYDLNAYTSFDETVYMLPIPADKLETGLQVLENWALHLNMEGDDIDGERGVILEEMRGGKGAGERMRDKFLPVMLAGSKYPDRLPIGKEEVLKTFPYEVLRDFYHDWYRPNNMAVIAVGDFDPAVVEKQIIERFGKVKNPKKAPKREEMTVPYHSDSKAIVVTDKEMSMTQVQIMFKHQAKKSSTQKDYVEDIINQLYGTMLSMRLQEITQKPGAPFMYALAQYGNTGIRPLDAFTAIAICPPGGSYEAFKALLTETERVQRFGFTASELERAKAAVISSYEKSYANKDKRTSDALVGELQRNFLVQEPMPGIEVEYALVKTALPSITIDDVNALSANFVTNDNRVVIILGPEGQKYPSVEQLVAGFDEVEKDNSISAYKDEMTATQLMEGTPKAGKVVSEKKYEKSGVTEWTLSNGAKVVLKPTTFKDDEVLFGATSFGGRSLYGAEDDINIRNTVYIKNFSGLNGIKKNDLQKLLTGKNARVNVNIGTYNESMSGSFVGKDAKTAFELIYLNFTAPMFDREAFEVYKENEKAAAKGQLDDPSNYFAYQRTKFLSNGNPRVLNMMMPEDYDKIDLARCEQIYKERFAGADDFTFFFVGSFTPEQIKPMVETYIASLPATGVKETYKDLNMDYPKGGQEVVFNKGVDAKAQVRLIYKKNAPYSQKEALDFETFNEALSMRLLESLREEMGGTYSTGAYGQASYVPREEAVFQIVFASNLEMYKALYERAMKELDKILKEGPSEKEVASIKEQHRVQWAENIEKNNTWLSLLSAAYNRSDSPEDIFKEKEYIESLNAKDMQKAGNKYISADQYLRIICLPEKK